MPDNDGNQKGEATETPLHAYKEGRAEDIVEDEVGHDPEPSDSLLNQEGDAGAGNYQSGGHPSDTGFEPAADSTGNPDLDGGLHAGRSGEDREGALGSEPQGSKPTSE